MKVEILGSGGATTTPRPGCTCPVCVEARAKGLPYTRTGPSIFVHGPNVLFDTPEESKAQLDRAGLREIAACFYSHWHPDHTMGRRVWETRNGLFRAWPRKVRETTAIYLPAQVAADFRVRLGGWEHLTFMEERGWIDVHELTDGETVLLHGVEVRPFRLAEDYVYAFELRGGRKRVLVAPDELKGWRPPPELHGLDLAVLPMGVCEHDPFTGKRRIHADHPVLQFEATFAETLRIVDELGAKRTLLAHIEEMDGLSFDDLLKLEGRLQADGRNLVFAYDGMAVDV